MLLSSEMHLPERITEKFVPDVTSGCWLWTAANNGSLGYGIINWQGRNRGAHIVVYELLVGPIPDGLELDHLCRTPACVNPAHLEPVTHAENVRRGLAGPVRAAQQLAKTHCPQGHEYSSENTYSYPGRAGRHCKSCNRERMRAARRKQGN